MDKLSAQLEASMTLQSELLKSMRSQEEELVRVRLVLLFKCDLIDPSVHATDAKENG